MRGKISGQKYLAKIFLLSCQVWSSDVMAFNVCEKDYVGQIFCAHPGGVAIKTLSGVVCGKGACTKDAIGKFVCSNTSSGGVSISITRQVYCIGECEPPKAEYCIKLN
jgi:hypothetical protein